MAQQHATVPIHDSSLQHLKVACSSCSVHELCLPLGLSGGEVDQLDTIITHRVKIKKGQRLYRSGEPLHTLYAVRLGFFKTVTLSEDGREQVTGFQMAGELLGMDAISTDTHACDAIALEDSEACPIPFADLEQLFQSLPSLQRNLNKLLSREIVRDHGMLLLMGNMNAEERLAAFLTNLSQRLSLRGYSPRSFILRMTREDIGSYLGLRLETVSRSFSRLQEMGLIRVEGREIEILDLPALKAVMSGCAGRRG